MNIPCAQCNYDPTLPVLASWEVHLDLPAVSQNKLKSNTRGRSGWAYRRYKGEFSEEMLARCTEVPQASEKRRVTFTRHYDKAARRFDHDNLIAGMKPLRDVLTELGIIVNDSDKWLEAHYSQLRAPESGIIILIEDILWNSTQ